MEQDAEDLLGLATEELKELAEQGCETWELERRASLIRKEGGPDVLRKIEELWEAMRALRPSASFPYEEPSALEEIRACRPQGPRHLAVALSDDRLDQRTLGAWRGRVAGCMLGKPVEGWRREKIGDLLEACGLNEITDYFPECPQNNRGLAFSEGARRVLRGNIRRAERDDDIDYTIVGLCLLERHGRDFTPRQVAEFWLRHLPFYQTFTAERAAYRNFVDGIWPPDSALCRNPYREWIGAQIRADAFGCACPGRPEQAAGLAWKDASISHVKNGIYGEMWVAAMLAAAFVADEPKKIIDLGLSEIPCNCRLSQAIWQVQAWHEEGCNAREATDRILDEYGGYSGVHTINNAAIVAMALLWGEGDFSRTVGLAVRAGLDTDCNGATAGSVAGAMLGADAIPAHWFEPLNDRVATAVAGEAGLTISGLAERTRRVQDQA